MPIEILMPALSPTMTEGTLANWLKKEGDAVSAGDVIAEIETDKATMEVEAVEEGTLGKILIAAGTENVKVNAVIALLLEEGEDKKALDDYKPATPEPASEEKAEESGASETPAAPAASAAAPVAPTAAPSKAPTPTAAPKLSTSSAPGIAPPPVSADSSRVPASPVARRLAAAQGVDLAAIPGTGPKGRIVKEDVETFIARGGSGGMVRRDANEWVNLPNSSMRKTVARRLTESKQQVPHFYLNVDCRIDALMEARKQLNDQAAQKAGKEGTPAYKLSVNDWIIKAVALGMRDVPESNASWYDDAITQYTNVDVSVAVAIEGGLITPIVRNADQKSLPQISNEMKDLAARARAGKLAPEEYQGGGFSISNLGMYGIKQFSAIINPPQACILAIGAGETRPVFGVDGQIEAGTFLSATLSVDHRAVDGAVGAEFLSAFKRYVESPVTMLV